MAYLPRVQGGEWSEVTHIQGPYGLAIPKKKIAIQLKVTELKKLVYNVDYWNIVCARLRLLTLGVASGALILLQDLQSIAPPLHKCVIIVC